MKPFQLLACRIHGRSFQVVFPVCLEKVFETYRPPSSHKCFLQTTYGQILVSATWKFNFQVKKSFVNKIYCSILDSRAWQFLVSMISSTLHCNNCWLYQSITFDPKVWPWPLVIKYLSCNDQNVKVSERMSKCNFSSINHDSVRRFKAILILFQFANSLVFQNKILLPCYLYLILVPLTNT